MYEHVQKWDHFTIELYPFDYLRKEQKQKGCNFPFYIIFYVL